MIRLFESLAFAMWHRFEAHRVRLAAAEMERGQ